MKTVVGILIILNLLLIPVSFASASPPFDGISSDKWAHFFGTAYMAEYAQSKQVMSKDIIIGVVAVSFGKELYDKVFFGQEFDWQDFWAGVLGGGAALCIN